MPDHAQYFKQDELSDCLLVIRLHDKGPEDAPDAERRRTVARSGPEEELARFPAHRIVLCTSKYFKEQDRGWQTPTPNDQQPGNEPGRPVFSFRIPTAEQLPAAEAVIAALYGVDAAISSLQHAHLVHALILADMLNASEVVQQAASCLEAAVTSDTGLSPAAMDTLAGLGVWPRCLQKLLPAIAAKASCCKLATDDLAAIIAADTNSNLQHMLLTVFGNLLAVHRSQRLSLLLLKLPLPAVQLLLASDALKVPSEDIVLYTAQYYYQCYHVQYVQFPEDVYVCGGNNDPESRAAEARKTALPLSQLVRAQYLTDLALHIAVLSLDSEKDVLGSLHSLLWQLISIRRCASGTQLIDVIQGNPHMPVSWRMGQRQLISVEEQTIRLRLSLPVLSSLCQRTARSQSAFAEFYSSMTSHGCSSEENIYLGGMTWSIVVRCTSTTAGTHLGIYVQPNLKPGHRNKPSNIYIHMKAHVVCITTNTDRCGEWSCKLGSQALEDGGWPDFWDVGFMANGWDEATWAAKGLPVSGDLVVELRQLSIS